jgi:hypothetical protein
MQTVEEKADARADEKVDVSLDTETDEKVDVAANVSETEEKLLEAVIALSVEAALAIAKNPAAAVLVTARKDLEILLPVKSVRAMRT